MRTAVPPSAPRPRRRSIGLLALAGLLATAVWTAPSADAGFGPPANDDFADASPMGGNSVNGTTLGATGEPDEFGGTAQATVWYTWTAPSNGWFVAQTTGGASATVYASQNTLTGLTPLQGGAFAAEQSSTFSIQVQGRFGNVGPFTLTLAPAAGPPNDNFTQALLIDGGNVSTRSGNLGASAEVGEPSRAGSAASASVWFSWRAPTNGTVTFRTNGFDTVLAAHTGSSLGALTEVAANDDDPAGGLGSAISFATVAGQVYRISVDGFGGATGTFNFSWRYPDPHNDDFVNAVALNGAQGSMSTTNAGSTAEPDEPQHHELHRNGSTFRVHVVHPPDRGDPARVRLGPGPTRRRAALTPGVRRYQCGSRRPPDRRGRGVAGKPGRDQLLQRARGDLPHRHGRPVRGRRRRHPRLDREAVRPHPA